jgi:uncharacterized protein YecE (DUF72 family)
MDVLRIGTAGWSYPSSPSGSGAWTGVVYPARQGQRWRGGKFDELSYYAERFDTVEVNSSFYRTPTPDVTRKWLARTPPGFEFSFKLYRGFTHLSTKPAAGKGWTPVAAATRADADAVRAALDPVAEAGKLGAVLAQFPASFKATPEGVDGLAALLDAFKGYRLAVELRHRSWSDDLDTTLRLLNGAKAAWAQIDEPKFHVSVRQNFLPNVTAFYYLRLHGRNARTWWAHQHSEERYNYLYSPDELEPFVEIAEAVRTLVRKMYLYTNNHFGGKAVANAIMLKERLGLPVEGSYPAAFVERFPELGAAIRPHDAADDLMPAATPAVTSRARRRSPS